MRQSVCIRLCRFCLCDFIVYGGMNWSVVQVFRLLSPCWPQTLGYQPLSILNIQATCSLIEKPKGEKSASHVAFFMCQVVGCLSSCLGRLVGDRSVFVGYRLSNASLWVSSYSSTITAHLHRYTLDTIVRVSCHLLSGAEKVRILPRWRGPSPRARRLLLGSWGVLFASLRQRLCSSWRLSRSL